MLIYQSVMNFMRVNSLWQCVEWVTTWCEICASKQNPLGRESWSALLQINRNWRCACVFVLSDCVAFTVHLQKEELKTLPHLILKRFCHYLLILINFLKHKSVPWPHLWTSVWNMVFDCVSLPCFWSFADYKLLLCGKDLLNFTFCAPTNKTTALF